MALKSKITKKINLNLTFLSFVRKFQPKRFHKIDSCWKHFIPTFNSLEQREYSVVSVTRLVDSSPFEKNYPIFTLISILSSSLIYDFFSYVGFNLADFPTILTVFPKILRLHCP
jgi:hypothetical protein